MPKIKIDKAFIYREAGQPKPYAKSTELVEVTEAVAQHAWSKGYAEQPKPTPAKAAKSAAEAPAQDAAGK
ncbi:MULTISPECIES: hypothetical protein [unclassified Pseudomonas]|uniref:hypothetical protein n=1 Tax=unclassified Pseudomonas TaxID=196821 RepID=UPI00072FDFDA|nr:MULTISPECIES: hypothetical protein [unclassified Pseudomonas]KSW22767.1 hypothetical protein AOX63_04935 [Pseudomonas sp. ADP]OBP09713.1 hypothetical protein BAE52_17800 [Pseudomonas sp. EGD-AKN5]QOF85587.1 glycogen branching protein [Pseudomonas sp. ADPe]